MTDVTWKEWIVLLSEALADCSAQVAVSVLPNRTLGVDADEAWLTSHLRNAVDVNVGLAALSVQQGSFKPTVRIGSSTALPSDITAARAHVDATAQTIAIAERVYARLFQYRVWIRDAPCNACIGKGGQQYEGNTCRRCGGLGVRNDPTDEGKGSEVSHA